MATQQVPMVKLLVGVHSSFGLSKKCRDRMKELGAVLREEEKHYEDKYSVYGEIYEQKRHDPVMIQAFEETMERVEDPPQVPISQRLTREYQDLWKKRNRANGGVEIEEIPADLVDYYSIADYDGLEWVHIHWPKWLADQVPNLSVDNLEEFKAKAIALTNPDLKLDIACRG